MSTSKKPWLNAYLPSCEKEIEAIKHKSIIELLEDIILPHAKKTAFEQVMPNGMSASLTYEDVWHLSDDYAIYLREVLELQPQDKVGIQLPNCLLYPIVALGIWKAGCVVVNINPLSSAYEMQEKFEDSQMKALVILDMFAPKLHEIDNLCVQHICIGSLTEWFTPFKKRLLQFVLRVVKRMVKPYHGEFTPYGAIREAVMPWTDSSLEKQALLKSYRKNAKKEDLCVLQYTGGTTGTTKAAMLSHANLMANVLQIDQYAKSNLVAGQENILTALPLYHIFAFTVNFLLFFYNAATNTLVPSPRPIKNLKKAMEHRSVTWLTGVNTLYQALLQSPWFRPSHVKELKAAVAGGMALHESVAKHWKQFTGKQIIEGYGLSEASPVVTFNPIGGRVKVGTIGIPIPSTDVKCVNERGKQVHGEEVGELLVRGPQVMQGYWQQEQETKQALDRGWLHTGDMATIDEEGYVRIVERKKDMIIVSGYNVYPTEVERCISQLPGVIEVGVTGQKDERSGEAVKAFVVVKPDQKKVLHAEQIKKHCKQYLSAYKVPRYVVFKESLPKTIVGKVLRRELKD